MGAGTSSGSGTDSATGGLDRVVSRAESRMGKIAITGRFHRAPKKVTDDYSLKSDVLGSGYNGSVYKATSKEGGLTYAVKDFKLIGINEEKMTELEGECEIFLSMDHPHVARLVDVYQSKDKLSLVMECMEGGELFDRVLKKKKFAEKDVADASYQMLLALNYIHQRNIVHRDIKLENFLYESQESDHLKLIDFGFSKVWDPSIRMKMSCGTLAYVAPEVLAKNYTNKCDMWSLGVVVFILLVGYMPFSGSETLQMRNIKEGKFTVKDSWTKISSSASDFVRKLILVNAVDRLSAEDALQHEFITKRSDLAIAAEGAEIDETIVKSLNDFAHASKFRRACMSCMAWSLTNAERSELRESFLAMDKNKTGAITLPEFKACIEEKFEFDDAQVLEIFASLDTSHTDEIQYSEFLAAMVASRVHLHDDLLKATFRRFDTESTGFIDVGDLQKVLGDTFEGEEVSKLMVEADANGDGKLSYEEFIEYAKGDGAHDSDLGASFMKATEVAHKLVDNHLDKELEKPPPAPETESCGLAGFFNRRGKSMRRKLGV